MIQSPPVFWPMIADYNPADGAEMTLQAGSRFGPYEIVEPIGSGGMGEVFRARDSNLKRDVALKVLPADFANDADRLARFQREAELLAALNHPNIATIHGLEKADSQTIIVMELVEGPTLAERIAEGPIGPDEAMGIALQIVAALEAAHGKGIVHRDLKPANVKIRDDGTVKVLDFGISKPIAAAAISGGTPVATTPAVTQTGVILGTAAYMSPEQARGRFVDERTDIWAFGCLLFEMLTGQPAFGGEDVMAILARVIDRDTDLSSMPGSISTAVRHTIGLCLQKDPARRIADIRDVRLALEGGFESGLAGSTDQDAPETRTRPRIFAAAGGLIVGLVLAGIAGFSLWPDPDPRPVTRFVHRLPDVTGFRQPNYRVIAISADGRRLVYNLSEGLYVREMNELAARRIQGTEENLRQPFFSADGTQIAYHTTTDWMKRISVSGGAPSDITNAFDVIFGAVWTADDMIYVSALKHDGESGIYRVPAGGGEPELLIAADGEFFGAPRLLPDGRTLLYSVSEDELLMSPSTIEVASVDDGTRVELGIAGSDARYAPGGHLVYLFEGTLRTVGFDPESFELTGGISTVLEGVNAGERVASAYYDLAANGTLVFVSGAGTAQSAWNFVWVDPDTGDEEFLGLPACDCEDPQLSPDGTQLLYTAFSRGDLGGDLHRWRLDSNAPPVQITAEPGGQATGIWSPDGERVYYTSFDQGIYAQRADGIGGTERLLEIGRGELAAPIAVDANDNLLFHWRQGGDIAVYVLPPGGTAELLRDPMDRADLSPDGRTLAYTNTIDGRPEIFLVSYPDVEARRPFRVSTAGGRFPKWSRNGRFLYFDAPPDRMMQSEIVTEPSFAQLSQQPVLDLSAYWIGGGRVAYDVGDDGRFLLMKPASETAATDIEIHVILNWSETLP